MPRRTERIFVSGYYNGFLNGETSNGDKIEYKVVEYLRDNIDDYMIEDVKIELENNLIMAIKIQEAEALTEQGICALH